MAATLGKELCAAVEAHAGRPMRLAFVTPEQAAAGFSSSTFSFNLPPPAGASAAQAAALAQRFVDALTAPRSSLRRMVSLLVIAVLMLSSVRTQRSSSS